MTYLQDLINPANKNPTKSDQYQFNNSVQDNLTALQYVMNPSVLTNANFSGGGALITQADGDNATFFTDWKVVGAAVATYTLTPTTYPANSLIQSASTTYSGIVISNYTTSGLYFYQRQLNTVRKYQKNYLTYGLLIKNNQTKSIKVNMSIYSFYDPTFVEKKGGAIYLQPGLTSITTQLLTDGLSGVSVGASHYTEFRLNFLDLFDGTADLELYQIKCEFGTVSTLLAQ